MRAPEAIAKKHQSFDVGKIPACFCFFSAEILGQDLFRLFIKFCPWNIDSKGKRFFSVPFGYARINQKHVGTGRNRLHKGN